MAGEQPNATHPPPTREHGGVHSHPRALTPTCIHIHVAARAQSAIETTVHKLARAKLHDLFLPSHIPLPRPSDHPGERHSETEMVEQILGLQENHRNDADELEPTETSAEPHTLDDGVLVEERRKAILKDVTRSRFGGTASRVRVARSISSKLIRKATSSALFTETETYGDRGKTHMGNVSPQPSSLDSPAKASRPEEAAKIFTADITTKRSDGDDDGSFPSSPSSPAHRAMFSSASCPDGSFRSNASSPSPGLVDSRLQAVAEAMPQWGCGERSIFGLHDIFGPDLLFFVLEHAFREFDLFEHFSIDAQKLQNLCSAIVVGYNDHPYHNYIHACDVTHGTYWQLRQRLSVGASRVSDEVVVTEARSSLARSSLARSSLAKGGAGARGPRAEGEILSDSIPKYAILAALIGGAIHDINHDGYNNAFHVATGSPLAMTYNDKSCLESMHASLGLQLLRHPSNDVLEHMPLEQRRKFRTLSVDMIMGTDLAHHFEGLSQMQVKASEGLKLCGDNSDLALIMSNVVHAADLGSTANPPHVYFAWMQRVFHEFFHQGERERTLGLPVTPFMDRPTAVIPKAQQGFLKYICIPLFRALVEVIPAMEAAVEHMSANVETLVEMEAFTTDQIMSAASLGAILPGRAPQAAGSPGGEERPLGQLEA